MQITPATPRHPAITALLSEHLADMALHSPPESVHALNVDSLCAPHISFWAAWQEAELLGCGALAQLDAQHGEIKSMRTATAQRRKGVAAGLLEHILHTARQRGYAQLSLETGSMAAFAPARALYARYGFVECGPFGSYALDPYSLFMTLKL